MIVRDPPRHDLCVTVRVSPPLDVYGAYPPPHADFLEPDCLMPTRSWGRHDGSSIVPLEARSVSVRAAQMRVAESMSVLGYNFLTPGETNARDRARGWGSAWRGGPTASAVAQGPPSTQGGSSDSGGRRAPDRISALQATVRLERVFARLQCMLIAHDAVCVCGGGMALVRGHAQSQERRVEAPPHA